ncbi:MAG: hypothetical protein EZS28_034398, partial [Streblomastix strix]
SAKFCLSDFASSLVHRLVLIPMQWVAVMATEFLVCGLSRSVRLEYSLPRSLSSSFVRKSSLLRTSSKAFASSH